MKYLIYNPLSGDGSSKPSCDGFCQNLKDEYESVDIRELGDYCDFVDKLTADDEIYIFGGDGTLNRFVNELGDETLPCRIYYIPTGTGNDFANDVNGGEDGPVLINEYIKDLPVVTVNGKDYKFINGVGYGIDGYCCEVGDKLKEQNKKPNYTSIAIKGLLFHYKPTKAWITVDGVTKEYDKVWLAPTMHGRYYGGGMIATPDQRRDGGHTASVLVFHGSGKLKTLMIFPSIFKGEHIKRAKYVSVLTGKDIHVKFDRPTALQIDGETILGVSEYSVKA